jgi:hypothetical protein
MPYKNEAGLGVKNFYGARRLNEGLVGGIETAGSVKELTVELSGYALQDNITFLQGTLPAGALVHEYVVRVDEAFALGGTTPAIRIGTDGSEATNGITISEATAEAVGTTRSTTFSGTWGSALAADTTVGVALSGTNPTVTDAGKLRVTIRYTKL